MLWWVDDYLVLLFTAPNHIFFVIIDDCTAKACFRGLQFHATNQVVLKKIPERPYGLTPHARLFQVHNVDVRTIFPSSHSLIIRRRESELKKN